MTTATLSIEEMAALRVLARRREAQKPPPSFIDFLDHVYIQPDMDREDYDPEIEFSPKGGVKWQAWPYLVERAESWEARTSESIVKARQLGISWLAAAFALWSAQYHPYFHVAEFSAGQREARVQLARSRFIYENLPKQYQRGVKFVSEEAECLSGSHIVAFPSTEHAGISFTFRLVIRDESAFHPYGAQNFAAVQPTLSAGGQFIDMSTANPSLGPSGDFHDRYWASKRGDTGYKAVFIPWSARPGRDAAWLAKQRAAFTGLPEEFDAYYPETDAAAFVGRSGLVYGQFDEAKVVIDAHPFTWKAAKYRMAGVDFGGGDPTAVVILGISGTGEIHQFDEFYERGAVTSDQIAAWLAPWERLGPILRVACDPSQGTAIRDVRAAGIRLKVALATMPADNDREGIGVLGSMLERKRFTIHRQCTNSIAEFPGYRWAHRTDPNDKTRYATSTPVDNHADAMDARRYALMVIDAMEQRDKPRATRITERGIPDRRPAAERMRDRIKERRRA